MHKRLMAVIIFCILIIIFGPRLHSFGSLNFARNEVKLAKIGSYERVSVKHILNHNGYTLLNYFSNNCNACILQESTLVRVFENKHSQVKIVGINSFRPEIVTTIRTAMKYDESYWDAYADLEKSLNLMGTPTLILVDGEGELLVKHSGYINDEDFKRKFLDPYVINVS